MPDTILVVESDLAVLGEIEAILRRDGHDMAGALQDRLDVAQHGEVAVDDQDEGRGGGHQPILCWSR